MDHSEQVIAESIDYLVAHYQEQPDLTFLAARAGYEPTYFQKLFKEKVGLSPKRLIQYMHMRHARDLLAEGRTTEEVAHTTGLSGTGRLYDLFVACEAVTPGALQYKGRDLTVRWGFHPTPLGEVLVAMSARGVCFLGFAVDGKKELPLQKMRDSLPLADFTGDQAATAGAAAQIMRIWRGQGTAGQKLRLDLHGTNMQIQVWQALLKIPTGETRNYSEIAALIGKPRAARAVGNAVGANPVSLLIPCHRVIRATGIIDNYGWGSPRKKLILAMEGRLLT